MSLNTPVQVAIERLRRQADGVLVLNTDRTFAGFLSPDDYRKLTGYGEAKVENDGTIDSLVALLHDRMAGGHDGPVVWTHAGSELLIRNQDITAMIVGHTLQVFVPVECDQTELQIVTLRYYPETSNKWNAWRWPIRWLTPTSSQTLGIDLQNPFGVVLTWLMPYTGR